MARENRQFTGEDICRIFSNNLTPNNQQEAKQCITDEIPPKKPLRIPPEVRKSLKDLIQLVKLLKKVAFALTLIGLLPGPQKAIIALVSKALNSAILTISITVPVLDRDFQLLLE
jgi:hypothetical protein